MGKRQDKPKIKKAVSQKRKKRFEFEPLNLKDIDIRFAFRQIKCHL